MINVNLYHPAENNFKSNAEVVEKEPITPYALQEGKEISYPLKDQEKRITNNDHKTFTDSLNDRVTMDRLTKKAGKNYLITQKKDTMDMNGLLKNKKNFIKEQEPKKKELKSDLSILSIVTTGVIPLEKNIVPQKNNDNKNVLSKITKDSTKSKGLVPPSLEKKEEKGPIDRTVSKKLSFLVPYKGDTVDSSQDDEMLDSGERDGQEPIALKSEMKAVNNDKTALPIQKNSEPIIIVTDRRPITDGTVLENVDQGLKSQGAQLSENLRESGNADIVQRAQIILKEADSGEIRLILKPDQLGTVRININLEENRVLGRIIVDSNMVKAAFDDNMADLRDAMLKSGFSGADLDVSVGGKGTNEQHNQSKHQASLRSSAHRVTNGENNFNSETINLGADIIKGTHHRLDVEA